MTALKQYNGKGTIQITGRHAGKSQAFQRLFEAIWITQLVELKLDQGTVYGSRYWTVEPVGGNWPEMEQWCVDTYGPTGSLWAETKNLTPEPLQRWYMNNRKFWFKEAKDRDWFVLRWSP